MHVLLCILGWRVLKHFVLVWVNSCFDWNCLTLRWPKWFTRHEKTKKPTIFALYYSESDQEQPRGAGPGIVWSLADRGVHSSPCCQCKYTWRAFCDLFKREWVDINITKFVTARGKGWGGGWFRISCWSNTREILVSVAGSLFKFLFC